MNMFKSSIVDKFLQPLVVVNKKLEIKFFNTAFAQLSGYSSNRIKLGESLLKFLEIENIQTLLDEIIENNIIPKTKEFRCFGKNKAPHKILLKAIPLEEESKIISIALSIMDVTLEEKLHKDYKSLALEKKIRLETEQRFQISNSLLSLMEPVEVIKCGCNLIQHFYPETKYITFINHEGDNMFYLCSIHPENQISPKNKMFLNTDFKEIEPKIRNLVKTIFDNDTFNIKHIKSKNDTCLAFVVVITPENSYNLSVINELISLVSNAYENTYLHQKLESSRKMEQIGMLAGRMAHDLNNILSSLVGYPDVLLFEMSKNDPRREVLEAIKNSGEQAADIVQDLLTLVRRGVITMHPNSINDIINKIFKNIEFKNILNDNSNLRFDINLKENLPSIICSSSHIYKAIINLIKNSIDSIGNGIGTISIKTDIEDLCEPIFGYKKINKGEYVTIEITDTGIGIPDHNMKRIFEPFFTTKETGKTTGTGLGLAIVLGSIEDHNGYININSNPGKGTTFKLYFPFNQNNKKEKDISRLIIQKKD